MLICDYKCPRCGCPVSDRRLGRCPRCHASLYPLGHPCSGSCRECLKTNRQAKPRNPLE